MASMITNDRVEKSKNKKLNIITCFCGDAFVDIQTSKMSNLPRWGYDTSVNSVQILAGGSLCNAARRYGALVDSYTSMNVSGDDGDNAVTLEFQKPVIQCVNGNDKLGQIHREILSTENFVNTNHIIIDDAGSQATCIVMTGESDRAFVSCNSSNEKLTPKRIYNTACQTFDKSNYFQSIYHLHIGGYFCCKNLMSKDFDIHLKMLKEKYPSKLTISLDTNSDASGLWTGNGYLKTVLPYIDVLFPNELEAQGISKTTNPKDALETLCKLYPNCLFIVTIGEDGVIGGKGKSLRVNVPVGEKIKKEDIVDTTGAGDSFAAAFLFEYLVTCNVNNTNMMNNNNNTMMNIVQNCCQVGNVGGSICVQQHGAVSSHYSYNEWKIKQKEWY